MRNVCFHIGRGGRFYNAGHKSFNPNVEKLSDCFTENSFLYDQDENGNAIPDSEWRLCNGNGTVLLEGRDAIESETGCLDWDGEYDTDIVKPLNECDEKECQLLRESYEYQYSSYFFTDEEKAFIKDHSEATEDEIQREIDSFDDAKYELEDFCGDDVTIESVLDRDSDAALLEITAGVAHTSVIVYNDGTIFTPMDWQGEYAETFEEVAENDHIIWRTIDNKEVVMLDGKPRLL